VTDDKEDTIKIEVLNKVRKHAKRGKVEDSITYQWNCGNLAETN
jgi:hypothetical protein